MKIALVTPGSPELRNGNRITALRWAAILRGLGHRVRIFSRYEGSPCDLMIALHALRSADSIRRFHESEPDRPLIVALTGTDLYRDIRVEPRAQQSLEWATRLVVLQRMALRELPPRLRRKTRVIYQSAPRLENRAASTNGFRVCVVGHLRPEKDPLRTALAARRLPESSSISVVHIGRALAPELGERARAEMRRNPRYRWLGELPHGRTRRILASSHLLSLTSIMEGSSNVLCEALASSVPVVASRISGLMGTLGERYPGYFEVGDTAALAELLWRAESDERFYRRLKEHCRRLSSLVEPRRERAAWRALLSELELPGGEPRALTGSARMDALVKGERRVFAGSPRADGFAQRSDRRSSVTSRRTS
jgi:putative glycosyltransferase (TIGR04348 family)